jgi:hypothetical protein
MEVSHYMEYASNGKANAGLTTGIIGTSLAGLLTLGGMNGGNGGILGGLFGRPAGYVQTPEGKIGQLESEIAFLRSENYADKVGNEVYKALDAKISANLEKLYGFVIDLDKRTALNAQSLAYENQITNNKIECCEDKFNVKFFYENKLRDLADANIITYVNANFVPGKLVMPLSSICPPAAAATTTTTQG